MNLMALQGLHVVCALLLTAGAGVRADEPIAACCHYRTNPDTGQLEEACDNLTEAQCAVASPDNRASYWEPGQLCGVDLQACPRLACVNREGNCLEPHPTPGCCDEWCCSKVCSQGPEGAFCCNIAWDAACVWLADASDCYLVARNDECMPNPADDCNDTGAMLISVPGSAWAYTSAARTTDGEPGFCCHNGVSQCVGGANEGQPCVVKADCGGGTCPARTPMPGAQGYGTVWFKFVQPASQTSAGISTCSEGGPPAFDSILQVFGVGDNSSPKAACQSLYAVACNDDAINCGSSQRNSRLCLRDLTPGATYYVMVAAKTPNQQGQYKLTISASCSGTTPPCPHCPAGEVTFVDPPSGVVDARRPHSPVAYPAYPEGIQSIVATGPAGASSVCWSACESPAYSPAMQIASITEFPPGTYAIHLSGPIPPGALVRITYYDEAQQKSVGRFIFHPGNVNGDSMTSPQDILDLVDYLNGLRPLPWGLYSGDLDRSEAIGPADILTLIDLLNGANGFHSPWNGTPLPSGDCP